ncbi:MAG: hypothetical protein KKA64_00590 [Nanoarchaeota archaeon]|nr:hypothetical protein [Nanoarchaeota archaeon]
MKIMKIIQEKENPLFKRKEIKILVESESNPSIIESEKQLSEKYSSQIDAIKVTKIGGKFGRDTFLISANIYSSKEEREKTEPKLSKKQKRIAAEKEGAK